MGVKNFAQWACLGLHAGTTYKRICRGVSFMHREHAPGLHAGTTYKRICMGVKNVAQGACPG